MDLIFSFISIIIILINNHFLNKKRLYVQVHRPLIGVTS